MTIQPLRMVSTPQITRYLTNTGFDKVLGGGFVAGSTILLGGNPGSGKSTALLQIAENLSKNNHRTLFVLAEESASQVKMRADRIKTLSSSIYITEANELSDIIWAIECTKPKIVFVDSIQMIFNKDLRQLPGTPTQMRNSSTQLINFAHNNNITIVLVGHTTKTGILAGAQTLQHIVDVVLMVKAVGNLRHVIPIKNRFGSIEQKWQATMTSNGLIEPDPLVVFKFLFLLFLFPIQLVWILTKLSFAITKIALGRGQPA